MEDRIDSYKAEHPEIGVKKFVSYLPQEGGHWEIFKFKTLKSLICL